MRSGENEETMDIELEDVRGIPPWKEQITMRAIVVSIFIGIINSIIVMKLNLTTGFVPNLNVSAALLTFVLIRTWTKLLKMANFAITPFTRQENTIIQTCAVACYSISVGGGFGSYLLGLNKRTYELAGLDREGNSPGSYKEPRLDWMIGFLFVVSFVGLSVLSHHGKCMVIDEKLPLPSGSATAVLINGFHTAKGDKKAKKQVQGFMKFFSLSFLWSFFQWFYSGVVGEQCGFINFPTFGLRGWKQTFYFDFSMTYVGAGMMCSHLVNLSLLFGALLSWGVMWPLISEKKGDWFPQDINESSMKSVNGYKVFISIALILGDGLYNVLKTLFLTIRSALIKTNRVTDDRDQSLADIHRNELFVKESIPYWRALVGHMFTSFVCLCGIQIIFPQLNSNYVGVTYLLAFTVSLCNAYGSGFIDKNMAYNYGKVTLFILAALAGKDNGVVSGLILRGFMKTIVSISSDLMNNFKTGHLTLTSPRSILISQGIGIAVGCFVAPLSFFLFYKAFDVGNPDGDYKAPYALIYRNMAILGVEGFSAVPHHCLQLCYGFFAFAALANLLRDISLEKVGKWVPLPMVMAVPFLVGAYFAIDMCIGSLVVFLWHKMDSRKASVMIPAVASGLMCGDGLWILPSSILALAKINPPICMSFMRSSSRT